MIEQSLYEYLNGVTAITSIVNGIHVGIIPQGTDLPVILINANGGGPVYSLQGDSGLQMQKYVIHLLADKNDMLTLLNLEQAVRTALSGYRGTMGSTYATNVQRIMLTDVRDLFEPDSEAHQRRLEFDIDYCN